MKKNLPKVENVVVDEANHRTYVVTAHRTLTDGELFSAIRLALLRRRAGPLPAGGRLDIDATNLR